MSALSKMVSSSSSLTPVMKDGECRSWSELPYVLTSSILRRLDYTDILVNAQRVCRSWRRVCKDPAMWSKIDLRDLGKFRYLVKTLCRHILDLSQGGLVELDMWYIGPDSLLDYIAYRSSNLRSLKLDLISMITTDGLTEALGKLPLLEELELSRYTLSGDSLKVVGQSCPKLKTLKLHSLEIRPPGYGNDDDALAIAETMHGLRFLLLFGNCLTKVGLNAILDNCLDLEHLDLRLCFNFKLVGDLEKRCSERIKVLRRPFDSPDCPYDEREIHADISDDEVPFVPDTKMASSPLTPVMKEDGECRNWSELPYELMASILSRLDTIDILENAQKVCTSWHRVCKDPAMWRKIDFRYFGDKKYNLETMCRHAVDLCQGGLLEIDISCFGTDSLLNYIADRSSILRSLELALISVTTEGLAEAIGKLPFLEELEITEFAMWGCYLKVVGQSCPKLKTLKLNCIRDGFDPPFYVSDDDALAIAETMHGLRFLQLFSNGLTDAGLKAILDNCPDLEHLDLNHCFNFQILFSQQNPEKAGDDNLSLWLKGWSNAIHEALAELPYELTSSILRSLSSIDILENAQRVCTSWRHVCKDPEMWRKIDMRNLVDVGYTLEIMCRHAVDRSQRGLVEINIWHFATDSLLNHIAERSSNLRSLRLVMCSRITNDGLAKALAKLPLLEELEFSYCPLSVESLRLSGRSCPNLKTLKLNRLRLMRFPYESDDDALAIAETMPKLSHLQLFANTLTDAGLNAILDNCPNLEHLDLRECRSVKLSGDLRKRCSERIKVLREPFDFGTNPSTAKFRVAEGMTKRTPSSSGLAMTMHPSQKEREFTFLCNDNTEHESKIKHIILSICWFFNYFSISKVLVSEKADDDPLLLIMEEICSPS
ncbi:hypothetical protein IGI04_032926 [Brassica rapa subsp. trilocularis]|uniref:F-box domain-containing protein n=1 Tax=Brassica rapa subsp. trilocularis TaxID=1813537 RepID=A0ABQ7L892_BRACM|nr:hypothetical protein IGI04_032926 [Brassica rapa subsp. trilocularis]